MQSVDWYLRSNHYLHLVNSDYELVLHGDWHETNLLHVAAELSRHFFQNLFSKIALGHWLVEGNKLHDVSATWPSSVILKGSSISIKFPHTAEICIADPDDNNRAGKPRQINNCCFCLGHVADLAICQQKHNLVGGLSRKLFNVLLELSQQWCE